MNGISKSTGLSNPNSVSRLHSRSAQRYMWAYLFILPQFAFFLVFTVYPILMSYVYSFYDWSGIGPLNKFVFLDNFKAVLADHAFWNAFKNNMIYILLQTSLVLPLTLIMAILLNISFLKGRTLYRTIYFLPVITTASIVGAVMKFIFGNDNALFNNFLLALGIIREPVAWLSKPITAMGVLIIVGVWKIFGIIMVYWLAGLQTIPADNYEAAKIDGAGAWQTLRFITLPLLAPVGAVILLLTVVNGMHVFDLVKTLTEGGPFFGTDMVDLYIYRYAFGSGGFPQLGYASAAGVVFGVAIFTITLVLGWFVKLSNDSGKSRVIGH
ncbi:sugar ABC transporter permease [Paenibacillus filicis]|uniref:Sugar ABC transporter permease n=1 Tax=Paenibacillus gyeongsangnamensis TaxID=3388067 RepID=A0ABT4QB13_9BACL|nr:sugar ABC transporter permease [Paenibacillus filicis]MCZ8513880.1 sugar ABC transporter permease [Paenibacillus filicis]